MLAKTAGVKHLVVLVNKMGDPTVSQGFNWKEIEWPPGLLEEKKQQSGVFFDVNFYVYNHVDNRERARASY